jgi:hypothetical protein
MENIKQRRGFSPDCAPKGRLKEHKSVSLPAITPAKEVDRFCQRYHYEVDHYNTVTNSIILKAIRRRT